MPRLINCSPIDLAAHAPEGFEHIMRGPCPGDSRTPVGREALLLHVLAAHPTADDILIFEDGGPGRWYDKTLDGLGFTAARVSRAPTADDPNALAFQDHGGSMAARGIALEVQHPPIASTRRRGGHRASAGDDTPAEAAEG